MQRHKTQVDQNMRKYDIVKLLEEGILGKYKPIL